MNGILYMDAGLGFSFEICAGEDEVDLRWLIRSENFSSYSFWLGADGDAE
jgi:hypothetical protein